MKFVKVVKNNIKLLEEFLDSLDSEKTKFRYYQKRDPRQAIKNHLVTLLLTSESAVGYGHLDVEGDRVWLGICVSSKHHNKGYGASIMKELINSYDGTISLTVDKDNQSAINLYNKFGFSVVREEVDYCLMERSR
tara:strand:+ start:368 stop:772 length:405 start_codon:yes stop_codon:yes gene_type:complete